MKPEEVDYVVAAYDLINLQKQFVIDLEKTIKISPSYYVIRPWDKEKSNIFQKHSFGLLNGWRWHFHGFECEFRNIYDNRILRVDFGPSGSLNAFTSWGIYKYVINSKPPWNLYPKLQKKLQKKRFFRYKYEFQLIKEIELSLINLEIIEKYDNNLSQKLLKKVKYQQEVINISLASRLKISQQGFKLLAKLAPNPIKFGFQ